MSVADDMVYLAVELGIFEIDAQGRIWRVMRQQTSRWGDDTKLVKCKRRRGESPGDGRYFQVRVMFDGVRWITGAHRLVWRYFNKKIPDGLTVNHKDGKKKRNYPGNLELATRSEQSLHAVRVLGWNPRLNLGECKPQRGSTNGMAVLTEKAVRRIRAVRCSSAVLARQYQVSPATIHRVRTRKLWTHV